MEEKVTESSFKGCPNCGSWKMKRKKMRMTVAYATATYECSKCKKEVDVTYWGGEYVHREIKKREE